MAFRPAILSILGMLGAVVALHWLFYEREFYYYSGFKNRLAHAIKYREEKMRARNQNVFLAPKSIDKTLCAQTKRIFIR